MMWNGSWNSPDRCCDAAIRPCRPLKDHTARPAAYLGHVPLEQIQITLGHDSIQTTEPR